MRRERRVRVRGDGRWGRDRKRDRKREGSAARKGQRGGRIRMKKQGREQGRVKTLELFSPMEVT